MNKTQAQQAITLISSGMNTWLVGMEKFAMLMLKRHVPVRPARSAQTDGETMFLPPPEKLDEIGKLIYKGKTLHEMGHILHGTDFKHFRSIQSTKHGALKARFINIMDDIREETLTGRQFPGANTVFKPYWLWKEENILPDMNRPGARTTPILMIQNVGVLFIARCRFKELGLNMTYTPDSEVEQAYNKYFADLEGEALNQQTYQDSIALADKLYERVKDMIRDQVQPPSPKGGDKQQSQENDDDQGAPDSSDEQEGDANENDSGDESSDDSGSDNGEAGDEDDDSDEDDGGLEQESDEASGDSEDEDDPEQSSEADEPDGGSDQEESEPESDREPDESGRDKGDDSEDSDGESEDDSADNNNTSAGESEDEDESDNDEPEDEGSTSDESSSGEEPNHDKSDSDSIGEDSGEQDDDSADEDSPSESPEEGESDGDETSTTGTEKPDPETEEKINQALDDLNKDADELKTDEDLVSERLEDNQDDLEYIVAPDVRDKIGPAPEGADSYARMIKAEGIKLLGKDGRDFTRLFINQTKPHVLRKREAGRFDIRSFVNNRFSQAIYTQKIPGSLERAALAIALDNSASMSGMQATIANQLLSGLLYYTDKAGIPSLVAGYTFDGVYTALSSYEDKSQDMRRYPVRIDVIKTFEERYDAKIMRRCVPLSNKLRSGTPDLDCVRWLTPQLWRRKEAKKVLFVICDGEPTGSYVTDQLRASYKRYIQACKIAGIRVFGFGIQADISKYFGDDWSYVNVSTLSAEFMSRLKKILS